MPRRLRSKPTPSSDSDTRAHLKILELGERNARQGKVVPAAEAMKRFRERVGQRSKAIRLRNLP
jgi:hypothetical protein